MIDLAEFLLARIAEDEAASQAAPTDGALIWSDNGWVPPPWAKVRVLAEIEAKRQIVESWQEAKGDRFEDAGVQVAWEWAVRLLALPYTAHPDYDEEWRP